MMLKSISSCLLKGPTITVNISRGFHQHAEPADLSAIRFSGKRIEWKGKKLDASIKELHEKIKNELPNKPKMPHNTWVRFFKTRSADMVRDLSENGTKTVHVSDLSQAISAEWRNSDKTKLKEDYMKDLQQYQKRMDEYENSLTTEQKEYINLYLKLKLERRAIRKLINTKPPKLPSSSFNFFFQECFQNPGIIGHTKNADLKTMHSLVGEKWRVMDSITKEAYRRMEAEDKERFQREFAQWYDSIQQSENLDTRVKNHAKELYERYKSLDMI